MDNRALTCDDDLRPFAQAFFDLTGVALPPEYLGRGVVRGWYSGGELAAGFACVTRPPFRVLSLLPDGRLDDVARECIDAGTACELNGLFIRPEFRRALDIVAFVKAIMQTFVGTGKAIALFGYNSERANLAPLYQRPLLSPVRLFEGRVIVPSGLVSASNVYMGYLRAEHIARVFRIPFTAAGAPVHRRTLCAAAG
jgi:hypothetical protein